MRSKVRLGPAQETLLIPLYGRAMEMRQRRPWMRDERAVELVDSIDYDFSKFKKGSLIGSVLRGAIFDHWVAEFLREHPSGSVIEIGAGLNTRYERLDNGTAKWLEIDLPDAMDLRRRFFEETERRTMHAGSITDPDWVGLVEELPGPRCFVSEAVLLYVSGDEVRDVVGRIGSDFPGSTLLMDTWGSWFLRHQEDEGSPLKKLDARIDWGCDDPAEIESWAPWVRLLESRTLGEAPDAVRRRLPLKLRLMSPVMSRTQSGKAYRLNRFAVG